MKRVFEPPEPSRPFSGNAEWKRFYREGDGFQRPKSTARERGKTPTREGVISPHPASFLFTHKLCLSGLCPSLFFLFLYYPSRLNLALLLPIPFPFSLSSQLAASHLQPCLLYLLRRSKGGGQGGQKNTPKIVPPSRKYLQLEDESSLKHAEGIPPTLGCVPLCPGTFSGPKGSCLHVDIDPPQMQLI